MGYKSDIEIAQETTMAPITEIAEKAGIDEKYLDTDSRIYIRLNHDKIYEAFPMDVSTEDGKPDSSGFCLYLDRKLLAADGNQIEILTGNEDSARIIAGLTL